MLALKSARTIISQLLAGSRIAPIQSQVRSIKKSIKDQLDYSKYPEILEKDLEETFVFGWGPGGQHVNKTENCVQLKHVPTGLRVKCHQTRVKRDNQKIAREILREKVDFFLNGENSIANQIKRIQAVQLKKNDARAAKRREVKKKFKESLLNETSSTESTESPGQQ